ncbi:phage tail protein, partial [Pseudomonas syringae group genomosp. 3]
MIDQTSQFFATLTNVGAAKQANADALGVPWKIAQMGVGDANGTDPVPDASQKKLINERRRAPLNQLKVDPANTAIIIAEQVIPAEVGGFWIREIGLYDTDGDLVAVANCAPSFKPLLAQGSGRTQIVRINLLVSNTSNVELRIDPTVVLATRSFVDLRIQEELSRLDNKQSVRAATTGPVVLAGIQSVDGVALVAGDRVLVKNQASGKDNGLYSVVAGGAWLRVVDADVSVEVTPNLMVSVEQGDALFDTLWQLTTNAPITLGTTALAFEQVAGPTGVLPGTYNRVTVDRRGLVMAGFNPTTLGGYGIADAYSKTEIDARVAALQPKLGFVPVQQGTGAGQLNNQVRLGWSGSGLKAAVDNTDLGNLWYSGNFDPATKANVGSTLFAYGITDAYTKAEVDQRVSERALRAEVYAKADVYTKAETDARDSQRPLADSITNIGLAANDPASPYMRRASDNTTYFLQTKLGFVPVQQGTGAGQLNNLIKIGYTSAGQVKLAVDNT